MWPAPERNRTGFLTHAVRVVLAVNVTTNYTVAGEAEPSKLNGTGRICPANLLNSQRVYEK